MGDDVAVLRAMAGLATPMAVRVAVTLGLPARLRGAAVGVEQLAGELGVSATALRLLLAHLATLGIVEVGADGYRATARGEQLCDDAGNGLGDLLRLDRAGGRAELAFVELAHTVATGEAGYARRYGRDFWADLAVDPRLRASFDRQMTHRLRAQLPDLVAGFDWDRFATIVDVGGGHGTLLAAILVAHPGVRGHLVDLEPTASEAVDTFRAHGVAGRARVSPGSFFDPLPTGTSAGAASTGTERSAGAASVGAGGASVGTGAVAYLLCDILHDWDDRNAHVILGRCAEAAGPDGRILIIEPVGGLGAASEMDLAMLVMFGGRERRVEEFRALGAAHGLTLESVLVLTGQRCLLEFRVDD